MLLRQRRSWKRRLMFLLAIGFLYKLYQNQNRIIYIYTCSQNLTQQELEAAFADVENQPGLELVDSAGNIENEKKETVKIEKQQELDVPVMRDNPEIEEMFPLEDELNKQTEKYKYDVEVEEPNLFDPKTMKSMKKVLFWNAPGNMKSYKFGFGQKPFENNNCEVTNCFTTANRSLFSIEDLDALVWLFRMDDLSFPAKRSPKTRYIFTSFDSAIRTTKSLRKYNNFFNWTFTHRRDSDMFRRKGKIVRRRTPEPSILTTNFHKTKTKMAAWIVSNCKSRSRRERLVGALKKHFPVDIYGDCGKYKCDRQKPSSCFKMLNKKYFFYLSFENAICTDFVTEQFYKFMGTNMIPVVFGGGPYSNYGPPNSYINAMDFPSVQKLAEYMTQLSKDPLAYNQYFSWKVNYTLSNLASVNMDPWCKMCKMLNSENQVKKTYRDLHDWYIEKSNCVIPEEDQKLSNFIGESSIF